MFIKELSLYNFRNYEKMSVTFNDGLTVLYGDNAAGKTSIIEAIYLCTAGKSFRTNNERELVKIGNEQFNVKVKLKIDDYERNIDFNWDNLSGRSVSINDIKIKRIGEMIGKCKSIVFAPEDLLIIQGSPLKRRSFIDISICQLNPLYFYDLQKYQKILKQRNALLREINLDNSKSVTLEIWDDALVDIGSKIIYSRLTYLNSANEFYNKRHFDICRSNEKFEMKYYSTAFSEDGLTQKDVTEIFKKNIEKNMAVDISKGITSIGPHRDDYRFLLGGIDLKPFGSQGQQKTAIISLKLGELDLLRKMSNEKPVLLLDDVLSELDKKRQKYLIEAEKEIQTIITTATKEVLNDFHNQYYLYSVVNGNIVKS